jgi:hemoglobin
MYNVMMLSAAAVFFIFAAGSTAFAEEETPKEESAAVAEPAAEEEKPAEKSLYEKLPEGAIAAAVDKFYEKVLADDRVNGFFKGVDMDRQRAMQTAFLTYAFGGPNKYEGRDLRHAHAHLVAKGLNDTHFDVIVEHLGATLKEMGIGDEDIAHAAKIANSVRKDVLNQ